MTRLSNFLVAILLLTSVQAHAQGCDQPAALRGTDTPYSLWGVCLAFSPIVQGEALPMDSIVYLPADRNNGTLMLAVPRSALTAQFVNDVFDYPKREILNSHPLAQRGIELVLSSDRLLITIYPSVVVRLRTDILNNLNYRTFVGDPSFIAERVPARAYAATDKRQVTTSFADVFVQYIAHLTEISNQILPDGSSRTIGTVTPAELPPRRAPSKTN